MKRSMSALVLLAAVVSGCGGPSSSLATRNTGPDGEIELAEGEQVTLADAYDLTFLRVPADSRCPKSVVCVWAGDALVELAIRDRASDVIVMDTVHSNDGLDKVMVFQRLRVELLSVEPYPETPEAGSNPPPFRIRVRWRLVPD